MNRRCSCFAGRPDDGAPDILARSAGDDADSAEHGFAELRYSIHFNTPLPIGETSISGEALQSAVLTIP